MRFDKQRFIFILGGFQLVLTALLSVNQYRLNKSLHSVSDYLNVQTNLFNSLSAHLTQIPKCDLDSLIVPEDSIPPILVVPIKGEDFNNADKDSSTIKDSSNVNVNSVLDRMAPSSNQIFSDFISEFTSENIDEGLLSPKNYEIFNSIGKYTVSLPWNRKEHVFVSPNYSKGKNTFASVDTNSTVSVCFLKSGDPSNSTAVFMYWHFSDLRLELLVGNDLITRINVDFSQAALHTSPSLPLCSTPYGPEPCIRNVEWNGEGIKASIFPNFPVDRDAETVQMSSLELDINKHIGYWPDMKAKLYAFIFVDKKDTRHRKAFFQLVLIQEVNGVSYASFSKKCLALMEDSSYDQKFIPTR